MFEVALEPQAQQRQQTEREQYQILDHEDQVAHVVADIHFHTATPTTTACNLSRTHSHTHTRAHSHSPWFEFSAEWDCFSVGRRMMDDQVSFPRVCVARERERRKERMSERAMEVRLQHDNYGEPPVNYASFPALLLLLFAPLSAGRVLLLLSRSLLPAPAPLLARSTRISRDNLSRSLLSLSLPLVNHGFLFERRRHDRLGW